MFEVKRIIEFVKDCLDTVLWEGEEMDAMEELASMMGDAQRLKAYFDKNASDFFSGYYSVSIERAVEKIMNEYEDLIAEILERADQGPDEDKHSLRKLFQPLDDRKGMLDYTKGKAKPNVSKPILRIYGYKLDDNHMIISGFGIKLTKRMQDQPDLENELKKLDALEKYILQNPMER